MRVAFVLARYGREVVGGAETLARGLAREARRAGWDVEIWTTCAVNYQTWANVLPAGLADEEGTAVRRFPVDPWDPAPYHLLSRQMQHRYTLAVDRQYDWLAAGAHSSALLAHVAEHAAGFDALIMMPYLHTITYDAAWLARERLVLWPCLHDEKFAFMEPYRLLLESAWGVVFISPEEAALARRGLKLHLPRSAVVGSGVEVTQPAAVGRGADPAAPYLLYLGRLDHGKNVPLLYEYMARYGREQGGVRLVVAGSGPCPPPEDPAFDYRGVVSEVEKVDLLAGALALVQPSPLESFSLVMMESWLAGRPALVWRGCAVTRGHVQRSAGGLLFDSYNSFCEGVNWLLEHREEASEMGASGRQYVLDSYTWPAVFDRFATTLGGWLAEERP